MFDLTRLKELYRKTYQYFDRIESVLGYKPDASGRLAANELNVLSNIAKMRIMFKALMQQTVLAQRNPKLELLQGMSRKARTLLESQADLSYPATGYAPDAYEYMRKQYFVFKTIVEVSEEIEGDFSKTVMSGKRIDQTRALVNQKLSEFTQRGQGLQRVMNRTVRNDLPLDKWRTVEIAFSIAVGHFARIQTFVAIGNRVRVGQMLSSVLHEISIATGDTDDIIGEAVFKHRKVHTGLTALYNDVRRLKAFVESRLY